MLYRPKDDDIPVVAGDKTIGYVRRVASPKVTIDRSVARHAVHKPRWAAIMLDGTLITRNSRTKSEAIRSLKAGIKRRVDGKRASQI